MTTEERVYDESYWDRRPPGDGGRLFIHRYCSLDVGELLVSFSDIFSGKYDLESELEGGTPPRHERVGISILPRGGANGVSTRVWQTIFVLLKHSTLVVILLSLALFGYAELSAGMSGLFEYLPNQLNLVTVVIGVIWTYSILFIVHLTLQTDAEELAPGDLLHLGKRIVGASVVYGGLAVLLFLSLLAVYLVLAGHQRNENIVFMSGYLFLLYLGGPLVYDGILRTERLFSHLDTANIIVTGSESGSGNSDNGQSESVAYRRYKEQLNRSLSRSLSDIDLFPVSTNIPTAFVGSIVFVSLFGYVWWISQGPFNLDSVVILIITVMINVIIVIMAMQFIVLVKYLNDLFDSRRGAANLKIRYRPTHPDNAGGLRDLGRFITRVNTLLLLSSLYLSYRLIVQGLRDPVVIAGSTLENTVSNPIWVASYLLPVVAFGVVIVVWFYFSFWSMHRMMARKKFERILQSFEKTGGGLEPPEPEAIEVYRNAPVWPINSRVVMTLVSLDIVSLLVALPALFVS